MAGSIGKYNILVTGGAGFIGTHTVVRLLKNGFKVSIIDNLVNAPDASVNRTREIVGSDLPRDLDFHLGDIRDKNFLEKIFSENQGAFPPLCFSYGSVCFPALSWIFCIKDWSLYRQYRTTSLGLGIFRDRVINQ